MSEIKRIILDTDVGVDDALALLLLLNADKKKLVKIEAICCTYGNTTLENVCKNVVRLLELTGRTDIPVYRGSPEELITTKKHHNYYHGKDGFGDLKYETESDTSIVKDKPSALAMYEIAKKFKNDIYLICLAPLTNVALAMKLYPDFAGCLKEIYAMGGNYKGIGNISKTAEFNFYIDPESVHIVFSKVKCPIHVLPLETCRMAKITYDWRLNVFGGKTHNPAMQLLNKVELIVHNHLINADKKFWNTYDPYLAVIFVYPECVQKSENYHATVELFGNETRGQMVLDHNRNELENVRIIKRLYDEEIKKILMDLHDG